ncbi:MAG: cytochrome c [Beijerinckiaceae bacterium]|nr:cytochrome c [Beijerinckiaceae bacterium]
MTFGIKAAGALALALVIGAGAAMAQSDAVAQRRAAMKAIGDGNRGPAAMLRGEQAFDLAAVQAQLKVIEASATSSLTLYPENSKTGGDTAALPKIWEMKADFDARMTKFAADAKAAQVAIKDEASFKSEFPALLKSCGGCHTDYRARRG